MITPFPSLGKSNYTAVTLTSKCYFNTSIQFAIPLHSAAVSPTFVGCVAVIKTVGGLL